MTDYACGHSHDIIVMDSNPLSICAWMEWRKSVGYEGDKSLCWHCWNKKQREEEKEARE